MAHSFSNELVHVIFGTKDRRPTITPDIRPRLWAYIGGIVQELGATPLITNGPDDHGHASIGLPPTLSLADVVRVVKTNSSKWVHEQSPANRAFGWQSGYSAFSVSQSSCDSVRAYIANQEEHHRHVTFQEEYITFLKRHGIQFDERYVFE
jgi:REP element-mobilizing transposase RayT